MWGFLKNPMILAMVWFVPGHLLASNPLEQLRIAKRSGVAWQIWSPDSFTKAKEAGKPVLVVFSDHAGMPSQAFWRSTWADGKLIKQANNETIPVLVHKLMRPELLSIYQAFIKSKPESTNTVVAAMLRPDYVPLWVSEVRDTQTMKRFMKDGLERWNKRKDSVLVKRLNENKEKLLAKPKASFQRGALRNGLSKHYVDHAYKLLDVTRGGFTTTPQRLNPMRYLAAYRLARRNPKELHSFGVHAVKSLQGIIGGDSYDPVEGGFFHETKLANWRQSNYEKKLVDNALMLWLLAETFQHNQEPVSKAVAEATVDFIVEQLRHPAGGFYHGTGTVHKGLPGNYYLYTYSEMQSALTADQFQLLGLAYEIEKIGNLQPRKIGFAARRAGFTEDSAGQIHLRLRKDVNRAVLAEPNIRQSLDTLKKIRQQRQKPMVESLVITSENGILLGALAKVGRVFSYQPALDEAEKLAQYLLGQAVGADGKVQRVGHTRSPEALLEDYAGVLFGLTEYYQVSGESKYLDIAKKVYQASVRRFNDPKARVFYMTPKDLKDIPSRHLAFGDGLLPDATAMLIYSARRLADLQLDLGIAAVSIHSTMAMAWRWQQRIESAGFAMITMDYLSDESKGVALVGDSKLKNQWLDSIAKTFIPNAVFAHRSQVDSSQGRSIGLLQKSSRVSGKLAATVCTLDGCEKPIFDAQEMIKKVLVSHPGNITMPKEKESEQPVIPATTDPSKGKPLQPLKPATP